MTPFFSGLVSSLQDAVDTIDAAGEYYVSQQEVADVRTNLTRLISELESEPPPSTATRVFGESSGGHFVGHHTTIAERHVREELGRVNVGLTGFREAVVHAERLAVETDGSVADRLRALAEAPMVIDGPNVNDGAGPLSDPDFHDS